MAAAPNTTTPNPNIIPPTPLTRLTYHYKNITRLSQIASPDLILHPADRALTTPPRPPLVGIAACQAHEEAFLAATGGTLVMEVESIRVSETGVFGCALGVLRAFRCRCRGRSRGGGDGDGEGGDEGGEAGMSKEGEVREGCSEVGGKGTGEGTGMEKIEMSFCGVWRFDEMGMAVEHWYVESGLAYSPFLGREWLLR
jgi:hypothetical protein